MTYQCDNCDKVFPSGRRALDQHCNATGHWPYTPWECHRCSLRFCDDGDRLEHEKESNHLEHECRCCYDRFETLGLRTNHETEHHHYCYDCDKFFDNANNARQHRNSSTHRAGSIKCPFCRAAYTTATGVTHHLEAGKCPNAQQLNRDNVYRFVRSRDPAGRISKKLIGWHGSSTYEATAKTWNGSGYECYICHRQFGQLSSLNQHLNSAAHQQALYHCPQPSCRVEFKTLASFINHVESESCGLMRFETVQNRIGDMMRKGRLLTA